MQKFNNNFFYRRDKNKKIITSRYIKDLTVGDTIKFFGKLYSDEKYSNEVATTVIKYKVLGVFSKGILLETNNKYTFNMNGKVEFIGRVFSSDFNVEDSIVLPYKIKPSFLSFSKGTDDFKNGYGYCEYMIKNNGRGEVKINMELIFH